MPHKRAKRSAREKQRTQSGLDLPPGARNAIESEEIPKGVARVLNAARVQGEYREKKRKLPEGGSEAEPSAKRRKSKGREIGSESKGKLWIQPGESMAHFNRRVEDSMRGGVRVAMKTSSALARKVKKEEEPSKASNGKQKAATSNKADDVSSLSSKPTDVLKPAAASKEKATEFERLSTSAPRRLNDIVQAPPDLKKLPRGAKQRPKALKDPAGGEGTLRQGALSMAQKAMLEEERLKAIKLYREMKMAKTGG